MKYLKRLILIFLVLSNVFITSSCWNYREVEMLNIVMGMAIDRDIIHNKYIITIEVASPKLADQQSKIQSEIYTSEGTTILDAIRNFIKVSGKRSFFGHTEVLIISKYIGEKDISSLIDWVTRDDETRGNLFILISKEESAKEILETGHTKEGIRSDILMDALKNKDSISKYPKTELGDVVNNFSFEGNAILVPLVDLKKNKGEALLEINGSAILKYDKIIGYLNEDETRDALWVGGYLKRGALVVEDIANTNKYITFSVYSNHTKLKPVYSNEKLTMNVYVKTEVDIAEIEGNLSFQDENVKEAIKKDTERVIRKRLEYIIKKVQNNYKSDIFTFGNKIEIAYPKLWKKIKSNWEEKFVTLPVEVTVDLNIRGSATKSKPVKGGA
jgi:germination protein, Ger(x)C family